MPAEILNLLIQVPVAGIIVVFVLVWSDRMAKSQKERDEAMRSFWTEQRSSDREISEKIVETLNRVLDKLTEHDKKTDVAIARMIDRTTPKKPVTKSKANT